MWHYFNLITYISVALWLLSGTLIYSKSKALRNLSITAHLVATLTIGVFIVALWQNLDRPPLRTLAETRIWYAFFMGLIGCAIYWLYRQKWMLSYSAVMGIVFIVLTYTHPDTMNKALMPALQSVWFIPHVIVYIFAYAMLGMASLTAFYGIYRYKKGQEVQSIFTVIDQLVKIGYVFLTLAWLFGISPPQVQSQRKETFSEFPYRRNRLYTTPCLLVWCKLLANGTNECTYLFWINNKSC